MSDKVVKISFFAHEAALYRAERTIKRLCMLCALGWLVNAVVVGWCLFRP